MKAQSIKTGKYMAIKCMKCRYDNVEQVNKLREIQALRRLSPHPNIIKLFEVLYDSPTGRLGLVFELMDMNIYEMIRGRRHFLPESRIKLFMYQLLKAMDHMHKNGIFHRDIKPENLLVSDDVLKVADFGSCRGIYSKQPYTEYISTRWYRAPECLLTDGYYDYKMDMWSVGCVIFEVLALFPLFPGQNEIDQIDKIHNIVGTPSKALLAKYSKHSSHISFDFEPKEGTGIPVLIPHVSSEAIDLIQKLLAYDPEQRISARQALKHPWFKAIRDLDHRVTGKTITPVPESLPDVRSVDHHKDESASKPEKVDLKLPSLKCNPGMKKSESLKSILEPIESSTHHDSHAPVAEPPSESHGASLAGSSISITHLAAPVNPSQVSPSPIKHHNPSGLVILEHKPSEITTSVRVEKETTHFTTLSLKPVQPKQLSFIPLFGSQRSNPMKIPQLSKPAGSLTYPQEIPTLSKVKHPKFGGVPGGYPEPYLKKTFGFGKRM